MPTKSSSKEQNKKLTDFFVQGPSTPAPSKFAGTTMSSTRPQTASRNSKSTVDPKNLSVYVHTRSASPMVMRKRVRSPDASNLSASALPLPKLRSPRRPMKILRSDVEHDSEAVPPLPVSRSSPIQRPTLARLRNNAPVASPLDSGKEVVFSSQSDEAELVLPIIESHDRGEAVGDVDIWRRKAFESLNSPSCIHEDAMNVGLLPSSAHNLPVSSYFDATARSATTSRGSVACQTPVVAVCLPSPPDTEELAPLPPTPEPLDAAAKTAKFIAEIKARAFAANQSSDDGQHRSFPELDDIDDDDFDDLHLIGGAKKRSIPSASHIGDDVFSSPLSSVPSNFNGTTTDLYARKAPDHLLTPSRPARTSTRTRKPAPASRVPLTAVESSGSASATQSLPSASNRKKSQTVNPLHALLREKELENKRGAGCTALRLAEEAVMQGSRETSVSSGDGLDPMNRSSLMDEQAAWKAVHEFCMSTAPVGLGDAEDFTIGVRESEMLGAAAGEAINKILASDKHGKGKAKAQNIDQKATSGVALWIQPSVEDMEVDSMSGTPLSGHPILNRLDDLLRNDIALLNLVLRSGVLAAVPKDILLSNVPQLLNMALFAPSQVADAVYIALCDLWQNIRLPFAAVLFALVRLGADPSILEGHGFTTESTGKNHTTHETLLRSLKRFLRIMKTAGFAGAFSSDDLANVILILVIMGLDPTTSNELHGQLNITLDVVCNHGVTDYFFHDILGKVLNFARQLAPVSRTRLVSFFASGSGQTRCIARHLAYCLLVSIPPSPDCEVLPLQPLILLLSPPAGSCEIFDVTNESTDYEELIHHVNILSVALVDIAPYVEEERATMKSSSSHPVHRSPNKSGKPLVSPLELLHRVLEALQGKIVDTRAAHLDRSRAKAAIQRLMMRVHFDRLTLIGARLNRRPSTLEAYFSPRH